MKELIKITLAPIITIILMISACINSAGIQNWYISLPMDFHVRLGFYEEFHRESDLDGALEALSGNDILEGCKQLILPGLTMVITTVIILVKIF